MPDDIQKPEAGFDPLDELLAKAQWPQSPPATQRLEQHWQTINSCRSWSIRWPSIAAVAAAAIVAIAIVGIWHSPQTRLLPQENHPLMPIAEVSINVGRPATNIELAMLRVIDSQRLRPQTAATARSGVPLVPLVTGWSIPAEANYSSPSQAKPVPISPLLLSQRIFATSDSHQRDRLLDDLLAQGPMLARQSLFNLLADQSTALAATAAVCRHPTGWIETLFAALNEPRIPVRTAAANALAQIDGPVVTSRLIIMADAGLDRREAVTALVQIHSNDARRFVALAMQSPDLSGLVRSAIAQSLANQIQTGVIQ
jgi:hypothetical protein